LVGEHALAVRRFDRLANGGRNPHRGCWPGYGRVGRAQIHSGQYRDKKGRTAP
jgi:hypothetical protein